MLEGLLIMGIFKSLGMISLGFLCAPLAWSAPLFTTATRNQPLNCETLLKSNL